MEMSSTPRSHHGSPDVCAIAGVCEIGDRGASPDRDLLRGMICEIRHRGLDGLGISVAGRCGFAHARLSTVDLESGAQPMFNTDRSLMITFNGEIFNHADLRHDLSTLGWTFRTKSDTEVLLQLYAQYGEDCVHHLNGQWAFAIWDVRNNRLFLSRDRMGVRPLFYTTLGTSFRFLPR